jgi:2-C-methyl-D-erythritol 4-phosphate cytidylyltransferase
MKDCSAILLAAGSSQRLGFDKILTPLAGRPAFRHAFDVLAASPQIGEIIIVTRQDLVTSFHEHLDAKKSLVPVRVVAGGKERQDSVYAGLQAADKTFAMALIHDAARPLITGELVTQVLQVARETGAAICGRPCADTLKKTRDQQTIHETPDRSEFWQVETPQVFLREKILAAYQHVIDSGAAITDDASAVEHVGGTVSLVESKGLNLKITRQADWEVLQIWLSQQRGASLRQFLHQINNELMPLTGFLPFLKKYREQPDKFDSYHAQIVDGTRSAVGTLRQAQAQARDMFPDDR